MILKERVNAKMQRAGVLVALLLAALALPAWAFDRREASLKDNKPVQEKQSGRDEKGYALWLARWNAEQKAIAEIKRLGGSVKTELCAPESLRKQLGPQRSQFVTEVMMSSGEKSDKALQHVKHFTQLKRLFLTGTQATDENLKHLIGLKKLEVLHMWNASQVTDQGFAHVQKLKGLKYLHCSYSGITDDALTRLHSLKHLRILDLVGNDFTDKALKNVSEMTNVRVLNIGAGNVRGITDEGLTHLKKLTQLKTLNLMSTSVTDQGLVHLEGLKNLKELWVSATAVTERGAAKLNRALPNLQIKGVFR